MAKHKTPDALFEIDAASWRLIEKAYGAPLQSDVRADIVRATEVLFLSQKFGRTGEAVANVKVILEAHDRAATRFFNELFGGASSLSHAGVYAHHLIENNFKPARLRSDKADLDAFLDFLRAFHIACNAAIKQLNDVTSDQRSSPWKIWVARLAEIMGKDKSMSGEGSVEHPLVQLVGELEKFLPSECQHEQAAIARALLEARSKPHSTME